VLQLQVLGQVEPTQVLQVEPQVFATGSQVPQVFPHEGPTVLQAPPLHVSGAQDTSVGAQQGRPVGLTKPPAIVLTCSSVRFLRVTFFSLNFFFIKSGILSRCMVDQAKSSIRPSQ